ncbi:hypothetical protein EYC84_010275 [Monilinia fructicola]|uniref:Uncharacterized protein n=1 Tax=Monilinia fructicola TaxID=38448 RepID=A0A5M9JJH7_MONFR|nr:hypothetical protein EYC84_010275 [Monilinia fructicola]
MDLWRKKKFNASQSDLLPKMPNLPAIAERIGTNHFRRFYGRFVRLLCKIGAESFRVRNFGLQLLFTTTHLYR